MTIYLLQKLRSCYSLLVQKYPAIEKFIRPLLMPFYTKYLSYKARSNINFLKQSTNPEVLSVTEILDCLPEGEQDLATKRLAASLHRRRLTIGSMQCGKRVLMLVVSDLSIDPRVQREAEALAADGWEVTILCPDFTQGNVDQIKIAWDGGINIVIAGWTAGRFLLKRPGLLSGELFQRGLDLFAKESFSVVHCHDLSTCAVGLALGYETGAYVVADFHEWTSENVHWNNGARRWEPYPVEWKTELQEMEARMMYEASAVITVSDSIAQELESQFFVAGKKVHVIRNVPSLERSDTVYPSLRDSLGVGDDQIILLWQGGTGPTRLLEPVIKALSFAPNIVFVIRGPSLDLFGEGYRKLAEESGAGDRLHLLPPVKSADVVAAATGADIGIWTLPNLSKNFYYALPNKIFEYLAAGLPLVCANFPEVRAIVENFAVGETFDPYSPKSIGEALVKLCDSSARNRCVANVAPALSALEAGQEWSKLVKLYDAMRAESLQQRS